MNLEQTPRPGSAIVRHAGDLVRFELQASPESGASAWLRTNIGRAAVRRAEIVRHVETGAPLLECDWHDVPMAKVGAGRYAVTLPLIETGRFEAKAFVLPNGGDTPFWPAGENVALKVEPAGTCCGNTLYTAFVRQFGSNARARRPHDESVMAALEREGVACIPLSGTFRDLIGVLDVIFDIMGFRILQLLPVHPTPTTYGRMGRFGSPFAALDFEDVDPALAVFDRRTTPLEQFGELVDAVHGRGGLLFIDIPINHTGWASKLQIRHPEWFLRGEDRRFASPGAWGVTWEDLSALDYRHRGLWRYMADMFRLWCRRGVDGFRCDAGYMVPEPVWEYIVAKVRQEYPDTLFLLEGLGGKLSTQRALLSRANLNWAYSELFQNYERPQVERCLARCRADSATAGLMFHFAETHDNNRLAARSRPYAGMRTALAALGSECGAFGISNGVEWYAEDKVEVHGAPPLRWGGEPNQVQTIRRLNTLLALHPCFHAGARLDVLDGGCEHAVLMDRASPDGRQRILVAVNLSEQFEAAVSWAPLWQNREAADLLSGNTVDVLGSAGRHACVLPPAAVFCLTPDAGWRERLAEGRARPSRPPERALRQRMRAKALEVAVFLGAATDLEPETLDRLAERLARDPCGGCAAMANGRPMSVVQWQWPRDVRRVVPVPQGSLLCLQAAHPFSVRLVCDRTVARGEGSMAREDGGHFAILVPPQAGADMRFCRLRLIVHEPSTARHAEASVVYLPGGGEPVIRLVHGHREISANGTYAVCANSRGAMSQVRGDWSTIRSQYDALLAANPDPERPVDRRVYLTRCRAWLVCRGYSQTLELGCQETFAAAPNRLHWTFQIPAGQGHRVMLRAELMLLPESNAVELSFARERSGPIEELLADDQPVRIIVRPDIEDRLAHAKTKAYTGPEHAWPAAVQPQADGFVFRPADRRRLVVRASAGRFVWEPEWTYMVHHEEEAERGLEDRSDLFSPGYFNVPLLGGERFVLTASADPEPEKSGPAVTRGRTVVPATARLSETLRRALDQFVVRRGEARTVIAGYPWFLDWGRDTLICLRGLIAARKYDDAKRILSVFGRYERSGTLPNVLQGEDDSNRETSDAPLWLSVACGDWLRSAGGKGGLLEEDCGGRTLLDVLRSIAHAYLEGTPNGIRVDTESGLVYSPAHFTWMDTNHPAGTPRQGYPIEIQALWHAALSLLAQTTGETRWRELGERVRDSVHALYPRFSGGARFLADCLHAPEGCPAHRAYADDHLRPNQLLAVTLGVLDDPDLQHSVLEACAELLVPGAIRSLADRPVEREMPIVFAGKRLNNAFRPYWGQYLGDEDTRRKPAYHNGTAWTWLFPSYCEALVQVHGADALDTARSLLGSSAVLLTRGCLGQIPEIVDGDAPHTPRGCGAQAWGVSELVRVLAILSENK